MPAWLLKVGAAALTMLSALGAASYVGGHVKSGSAPLHPPVVGSAAAGGQLSLSPSIRSGNVQPVTSTYAS